MSLCASHQPINLCHWCTCMVSFTCRCLQCYSRSLVVRFNFGVPSPTALFYLLKFGTLIMAQKKQLIWEGGIKLNLTKRAFVDWCFLFGMQMGRKVGSTWPHLTLQKRLGRLLPLLLLLLVSQLSSLQNLRVPILARLVTGIIYDV